jgi:hypothetical protein
LFLFWVNAKKDKPENKPNQQNHIPKNYG